MSITQYAPVTFFAACTASVGKVCADSLPQVTATSNTIASVIQLVLTILGAIALLIIVIAGFQYITSQGDPQKVARSKDAIIYALVGLVVAIFAQIIVSIIVRRVG